ncbi:DegT/DnrJ/EryC1/StrS family aminotransferase [Candidatus Woesearchaeota archaeon]|nr:DegT/DnrJ/EryC1/StrS family aminotransferase [Candidatus Woesearchaeota archaeon]
MIPFGDIKRQYLSIKDELDKHLLNVLGSGMYILGDQVKQFENSFANYCGKKYGVGVNSGTDALILALKLCNVKPGDEVITVSFTAIPTISAIYAIDAKPVFVDIGDNYTMDTSQIENNITDKTKVILPVHLYGNASDMDPIVEIANKYNLKIIEDCAQSHGTMYKGNKVPISGLGCFSFYPSKNLGAFGDGGMIVTDDIELYEKLILMRNYGQKQRYYQVVEGINSRLDEIQAAILNLKLKYLDKWNSRRSEIAKMYFEGLKDNKDVVLPLDAENSDQVFHLFVIRHRDREGLMNYLTSKGVQTLIHYPIPNHLQEYYLKNFDRRFNLPKTEEYSKEILSLPMFPELTDEEVAEIIRFINAYSSLK